MKNESKARSWVRSIAVGFLCVTAAVTFAVAGAHEAPEAPTPVAAVSQRCRRWCALPRRSRASTSAPAPTRRSSSARRSPSSRLSERQPGAEPGLEGPAMDQHRGDHVRKGKSQVAGEGALALRGPSLLPAAHQLREVGVHGRETGHRPRAPRRVELEAMVGADEVQLPERSALQGLA